LDPVAHHYPDTILHFGVRPPLEVDLRRALSPHVLSCLRGLGLGPRFGIVTSFDPGGRRAGVAENRRRLARLARRLKRTGSRSLAADGWSINGRHRERGFAIAAPRRELVELAMAFGQTAIFWFDGRRFLLVWCDHPARGLPLPARTL